MPKWATWRGFLYMTSPPFRPGPKWRHGPNLSRTIGGRLCEIHHWMFIEIMNPMEFWKKIYVLYVHIPRPRIQQFSLCIILHQQNLDKTSSTYQIWAKRNAKKGKLQVPCEHSSVSRKLDCVRVFSPPGLQKKLQDLRWTRTAGKFGRFMGQLPHWGPSLLVSS